MVWGSGKRGTRPRSVFGVHGNVDGGLGGVQDMVESAAVAAWRDKREGRANDKE